MTDLIIPPGGSVEQEVQLPADAHLGGIHVTGKCSCGGNLVQVGPLEWKCEFSRWYHWIFRKTHSHLKATITPLP